MLQFSRDGLPHKKSQKVTNFAGRSLQNRRVRAASFVAFQGFNRGAMMENPKAFDHEAEEVAFLARVKKKAANKFSFTKQEPLRNTAELAWWLYVFHRDDEALEVCRFLGQVQFTGNFSLWSWVERTLALQSRLLRAKGEESEARECIERIKAAGYVDTRLEGQFLTGKKGYRAEIEEAARTGDKSGEREYRRSAGMELCFIIELGGSDLLPVAAAEQEFEANLAALRKLLKVAEPG